MLEVAAGGGYRVSPCARAQTPSLWPYPSSPQGDRPRLAPGTSLCAVWTFLSRPHGTGATVLPPGGRSIAGRMSANEARPARRRAHRPERRDRVRVVRTLLAGP